MKPADGLDATIVEKRRPRPDEDAAHADADADAAAASAPAAELDAGEVDDELSDDATPGPEIHADASSGLADAAPAAPDPTHVSGPSGSLATVIDRAAQGPRSSAIGGSTHDSNTLTPEVALRHDELARTRFFLKIAVALASLTTALLPFTPEGGIPRFVTMGGGAAIALMCLAYAIRLRDDSRFTTRSLMVVASGAVLCVTPIVWGIGVYSPAPIVYTLGVYFFSLGASTLGTLLIYLAVSLLHLLPSVLSATSVVADPGVINADAIDMRTRVVYTILVQVVLFMTYCLARASRSATRKAIGRLHDAIVQVQKREALLAEAHQDLDRALKAGYQGRHTDRRLGPWVLGEVIGRGAMGEVYRGTHTDTRGLAAVKVLHPDVAAQPAHVRRFLREAEIVSQVKSAHVVKVLDVGTTDPSRVDRELPPYLAMELLDGHDLAWHLRRKRRLSMRRVLELVDQVANALTAAVACDVVHRDLKPQNLFLARIHGDAGGERLWKVLDFGVSKLSSGSGTLTQGAVVGTPGYMAPEQARGQEVGPSADVFALAAIAYRGLTGKPPFSGPDMPKVLFDVCYRQPVRPGSLTALPLDIERALAIGLAKSASERFQTARELSAALAAAARSQLPDELRTRADALLRAMPWNQQAQ